MSQIIPTPVGCCDPCVPSGTSGPPGEAGPAGAAGANGTDGINAFTTAVGGETMPAEGGTTDVEVASSEWASIGQVVYVQFWGYMSVAGLPSTTSLTLANLEDTAAGEYADNAAPGTVLPAASTISPAGLQGPAGTVDGSLYLLKANNLSDVANAGTSRTNLGLGSAAVLTAGVANGNLSPNDGAIDTNEVVVGTATGIATRDAATARALLGLTLGTGDGEIAPVDDASGLTDGDIVVATANGVETLSVSAILSLLGINSNAMLLFQQRAANGAGGGDFNTGAWQTVPLTNEVVDTGNNGSISGNQITLAAGTYRYTYNVIGNRVDGFQGRLYNITTPGLIANSYGTSAFSDNGAVDVPAVSLGVGRFTIGGATVIELQAQCTTTRASNGFGVAASQGVGEIYSWIELWKE